MAGGPSVNVLWLAPWDLVLTANCEALRARAKVDDGIARALCCDQVCYIGQDTTCLHSASGGRFRKPASLLLTRFVMIARSYRRPPAS